MNPQRTIEAAALAFRCTPADITGDSRAGPFVGARASVARVMREAGATLKEIGAALGKRHHTTIINLLRQPKTPRYGTDIALPPMERAPEPAILTARIIADSPAGLVVAMVAACYALTLAEIRETDSQRKLDARATVEHLLGRAGLDQHAIALALRGTT